MKNNPSIRLPVILTDSQVSFEDDCACPDGPHIFNAHHDAFGIDCACPATENTSAVKLGHHLLYQQTGDVYTASLPQDFQLAFSPHAPQGPSALNHPAWERWQSFNRPQPLSQPADILLAQQKLILPVEAATQLQPPTPEVLTAWLHITNACNLDCSYCYVRKSSASMSEATGLDAIKKIFQTAQKRQFKGVKIKYAGGEPTLQFHLLQKLSDQARLLSEKSGLYLQQVILSNGVHISLENAEWIIKNNIRLMISLDGVGEVHNQMRPYQNGKGSFQAVSQTIDQVLLPNGMMPMLSITLTQQNAAGAADTVRWALERDLPVSLNFYRHKPDFAQDLAAEENALIAGMLAAYNVYEEMLPSRPFLNGLLDRVQAGEHHHTCGVGLSYLVIGHTGALAQCQMLLDKPVSFTLTDDLLAQVQAGPLHNLPINQKEDCRSCVYRYRCTGGCPLESHRASGRWDAPSPNCRIYKTLLPHALRLEGLRLLKSHGYLN